jgi:hypothetical protein
MPLTGRQLTGGIIPLNIPLVAVAIYVYSVRKYRIVDASSILEKAGVVVFGPLRFAWKCRSVGTGKTLMAAPEN